MLRAVLPLGFLGFLSIGCGPRPEAPDASAAFADTPVVDAPSNDGAARPECALLASSSETLASSPSASDAPELPRDASVRVTATGGEGFVSLRTTEMHTTFVVLVLGTDAASLSTASGASVGDASALTCEGRRAQRIEHHSHTPTRFTLRITEPEAVVRYSVL
jgi:hypothetical protein